ncbi:MAG: inorganic diphosphatase [bacterium]
MRKTFFFVAVLWFILPAFVCAQNPNGTAETIAPGLKAINEFTLVGEKSFLTGYEAQNSDGTLNVVVEIPTGTTAKWEVSKPEGYLKWNFKNGKPRLVQYLGYPGNYGMIPKTLLPKELGGDGDPLDVIILGPAAPRGAVVKAKLLGVLKLLDGGEQDDKLIAVYEQSALYQVDNLAELNKKFPGVSEIIELWFTNYKGPGEMESLGFGDIAEARKILDAAVKAFAE